MKRNTVSDGPATSSGQATISSSDIHYRYEPGELYAKELTAADTLEKLRAVGIRWNLLASDANQIVRGMSEDDFRYWREGLAKERNGRFAGVEFAEKYAAILMPKVMFEVALIAETFKAPWGCAYIRMRDAGMVEERDGVACIERKTSTSGGGVSKPK